VEMWARVSAIAAGVVGMFIDIRVFHEQWRNLKQDLELASCRQLACQITTAVPLSTVIQWIIQLLQPLFPLDDRQYLLLKFMCDLMVLQEDYRRNHKKLIEGPVCVRCGAAASGN